MPGTDLLTDLLADVKLFTTSTDVRPHGGP